MGADFFTKVVRFPGGHMTWKQKDPAGMERLEEAMQRKGYHQVDWNALTRDAEGAPKQADELVEELKKSVGNREKAIILMHDTYGKEETAKALPEIVRYLKEQGYAFKKIQ